MRWWYNIAENKAEHYKMSNSNSGFYFTTSGDTLLFYTFGWGKMQMIYGTPMVEESCIAVLSPTNVGLWGRVWSAFGRCYPIGDFGLLFPRLLGCCRRSMLCECAVVPCCASLRDCPALESFYWLPCLVLPHNWNVCPCTASCGWAPFAFRLEGGVTVQVELCRFGGGATPLSDFSVPAWNGGAALAREMSLSLGSAVTYCLLLLRRCLRGGRFDCVRLLRFCSLPWRVFFPFSKVALLLRGPFAFWKRGIYCLFTLHELPIKKKYRWHSKIRQFVQRKQTMNMSLFFKIVKSSISHTKEICAVNRGWIGIIEPDLWN